MAWWISSASAMRRVVQNVRLRRSGASHRPSLPGAAIRLTVDVVEDGERGEPVGRTHPERFRIFEPGVEVGDHSAKWHRRTAARAAVAYRRRAVRTGAARRAPAGWVMGDR